jgi:hypothetical protein
MLLTLGSRTYDVTTRSLVIAAAGTAPDGADLVEVAGPDPLYVAPADEAGGEPTLIVRDTLFVDVAGADCPTAAVAVAVIRGARVVRTADVRGARRVCDVLAAVLEAR